MSLEYLDEMQTKPPREVENVTGNVIPSIAYKKGIAKRENSDVAGDYLSINEIEHHGNNLTLYYDWSCSAGNAWLDWKMTNDEYLAGFVQ